MHLTRRTLQSVHKAMGSGPSSTNQGKQGFTFTGGASSHTSITSNFLSLCREVPPIPPAYLLTSRLFITPIKAIHRHTVGKYPTTRRCDSHIQLPSLLRGLNPKGSCCWGQSVSLAQWEKVDLNEYEYIQVLYIQLHWLVCLCTRNHKDNFRELVLSFHQAGPGSPALLLSLTASPFICWTITLQHPHRPFMKLLEENELLKLFIDLVCPVRLFIDLGCPVASTHAEAHVPMDIHMHTK